MKHQWITNDYDNETNIFAAKVEGEFCNGPKCKVCGFEFCHHCNRSLYEDEGCEP